jgi:hypothetical protein
MGGVVGCLGAQVHAGPSRHTATLTLCCAVLCVGLHTLQEILEVEQVTEESQGMELNAENVDQVLGTGG